MLLILHLFITLISVKRADISTNTSPTVSIENICSSLQAAFSSSEILELIACFIFLRNTSSLADIKVVRVFLPPVDLAVDGAVTSFSRFLALNLARISVRGMGFLNLVSCNVSLKPNRLILKPADSYCAKHHTSPAESRWELLVDIQEHLQAAQGMGQSLLLHQRPRIQDVSNDLKLGILYLKTT
jgi:hypothetical protein